MRYMNFVSDIIGEVDIYLHFHKLWNHLFIVSCPG